jgi:hypothetical protein
MHFIEFFFWNAMYDSHKKIQGGIHDERVVVDEKTRYGKKVAIAHKRTTHIHVKRVRT